MFLSLVGRPSVTTTMKVFSHWLVIGLGAMGRHHVRVLGELTGVELVAVVDGVPEAVNRATGGTTLAGYADAAEMLDTERPDLVSIAVPTSAHLPVAMMAIGYLGDPSMLSEELQKRETSPRQRKKLDQFVFGGKWRNPAGFLA